MPVSFTGRLDSDEKFLKSIQKVAQEYVTYARTTLDYYSPDFDAAHDILMCYANLTKKDYVALTKGNPRRFILPVTATHVHTMTTYLAQTLFGDDDPYKVDGGSPDDDGAARCMNELLRWNSEQQAAGMYQLGWLWIENSLTYNRGVFYECYAPIVKSTWQDKPKVDPETNEPEVDEAGKPVMEPQKVRTKVGGYNRIEIVSPYDFYMDPLMPIYRMQEGRFAGHRINKTWTELEARSKLPVDDPMHVSPKAVLQLKAKPSKGLPFPSGNTSGAVNNSDNGIISRTAYERAKTNTPTDQRADGKDPGVVDFVELWARLVPKDYEIDERTEPEVFQILVGNEKEVLAVNESTYEHGMFPYSVGEARPSAFYQFSPSWVMILKNIQDYVDYLKNRHQEAVTRTIGNVFIAKSNLIDIADFEDPEKEGKFISILPEGQNMPINDVVRQVPMVDMTANFLGEMQGFISFAEATSGASQNLQGQTSKGETTATEFAGTSQMAAGRLSAIARLLSVGALVPQTRRMTANFQQFFDQELIRNVVGEEQETMDQFSDGPYRITNDVIQGNFTFRPHDGALPGTDAKKVAALTRALEATATFPQIFAPEEGNMDPRRLFIDLIRSSGGKPEQHRWRTADIQKAQQMLAQQASAAAKLKEQENKQPFKPALSVSAKIEQLTPSERFQIMEQVDVEETGLGGPMPEGMEPPHPASPRARAKRAEREGSAGAPGGSHSSGHDRPGPRPGLASALKGPPQKTAAPVATRPVNS